jgi:hypothetical protein
VVLYILINFLTSSLLDPDERFASNIRVHNASKNVNGAVEKNVQ